MSKSGILLAVGAVACLMAGSLAACTGPDGAAGPAGAPGATGAQGTPGPEGKQGPEGIPGAGIGVDGGITSSCLSPCHGFNGIVEQWKTSTHYSAFISNLGGDEVDRWTSNTGSCANCHAIDAIERRVAGDVGSGDAGPVANASKGQIGYRTATGGLGEATYNGGAKVAAVTCVSCHSVSDASDPHRTGAAFTPGSFPLRVASGPTDEAFIEKSPDTSAVVGTGAGALGGSNTCVFCHKSRKDVTNYITATNKLTSRTWGPHDGPVADVYSGKGGYHFAGLTYDGQSATHRIKSSCVDCHMPTVAANGNTPDHSFRARLPACQTCHAGATSFDVDGLRSQFRTGMFALQAALNEAGWLTRNETAPYNALSAAQLKDGAFELDRVRPTGGADGGAPELTADEAGALYNYFILARGSALGVHNPKYSRQLLFDSYKAIKSTNPPGFTRP